MMTTQLKVLSMVGALALFAGCNGGGEDGAFENTELDASADVKADQYTKNVAFEVVDADLGSKAGKEGRWLVTSKASYESFFKAKAPAGVKWGQEWVYIYAAGTKNTGGFAASISQITFNKKNDTLRFFDNLEAPGADCFVTYSLTHPFVAVKFKKQGYDSLKYTHADSTRLCNLCATVKCTASTHCETVTVYCITAPCPPPHAECVPNEPEENPCNLIDCGPGQTCELHDVTCITAPCNPVPECVPVKGPGCTATLCGPNTTCVEDENGNASCEPIDPCALMKCASGTICTHTGNTTAACIKPAFCGGIANIQCKGALECIDNPFDSCDPNNGGADCGGICQCTLLAKCAAGYEFNRDPNVCSCVKATN